jgi:hypothetical protein
MAIVSLRYKPSDVKSDLWSWKRKSHALLRALDRCALAALHELLYILEEKAA